MTFQFQTLSVKMSLLNINLPSNLPTITSPIASTSFQTKISTSSSPSSSPSHHNIELNLHVPVINNQNEEIPHCSSSIELEEASSSELNALNPLKSGRTLRRRSSENDYFLHRTNRRTIQKPNKLIKKESIQLKTRDIKKLYLNQTLKGFRPTNLETIFEEPSKDTLIMSVRKYNRNKSLSDGLNITKMTLKKRREKIKKQFGKKFALKKISLELFHEKLNSSVDDNASDSDIQYLDRGNDLP